MQTLFTDSISIEYNTDDSDNLEMDAKAENDASRISIQTIDFLSKSFGVKSVINTTPLAKGSVIRLFRLETEEDIITCIILFIYNNFFFKNLNVSLSDILNRYKEHSDIIKKIFERCGITDTLLNQFYSAPYLQEKKNNYYRTLKKCTKIKSVTIKLGKNYTFDKVPQYEILSNVFDNYIKYPETIKIYNDNCKIYIIKPVIQKGNNSLWGGFYDYRQITFKMQSKEFKTKSQNGEVNFTAGCYILCSMTYLEFCNEKGEIEHKEYVVHKVYDFCNNGEIIKTQEGKRKLSKTSELELEFKD